jgi:hypothetical protein
MIGKDLVYEGKTDMGKKDVYVAIRPEGFLVGKKTDKDVLIG